MLPQRFTLKDVQIPCLSKLIPWTLKRLTHVHPVLTEWHQAVRVQHSLAYGYKDKDYFIAKLYALHLAKFVLIG